MSICTVWCRAGPCRNSDIESAAVEWSGCWTQGIRMDGTEMSIPQELKQALTPSRNPVSVLACAVQRIAPFSPRWRLVPGIAWIRSEASHFSLLVQGKVTKRKDAALPRQPPRFSDLPGVGGRAFPGPPPTRANPRAPLRADPGTSRDARRGKGAPNSYPPLGGRSALFTRFEGCYSSRRVFARAGLLQQRLRQTRYYSYSERKP